VECIRSSQTGNILKIEKESEGRSERYAWICIEMRSDNRGVRTRDQDSDGILDCPYYSSRMLQRVCVSIE
jgi:hypothetical protein